MSLCATSSGFALGFMLVHNKDFRQKFYLYQKRSWLCIISFALLLFFLLAFGGRDAFETFCKYVEDHDPSSAAWDEAKLRIDRHFVGGLVLGVLMCTDKTDDPWVYPVYALFSSGMAIIYGYVIGRFHG